MSAPDDGTNDTQTWRHARTIFDAVVGLPADARIAAIDAHCGGDAALRQRVQALLAADAAMPPTSEDPHYAGIARVLNRLADDVQCGRRFGAFAVVEEIGRGGMGVVYLAERVDGAVAQRVALKLVAHGHLDADASARLARERRVLATLEHPNIARLIDAGEDPSGIPYFAMEYVKGETITRWCDRRALSLAARLRLFRQVCAAVQYAHANLVVHCDLKAGNILVTEDGLPKLLDFGIATTLDAETPDGENRFLSPASAAPEQLLGQPSSVATDVYALGVLLCELAGGRPPFDGDVYRLRQRVLEDAPRLPSAAAPSRQRELRGDIDAIVARALAKAPRDRYASVEQFDADVAAHLATRPLSIRAGERGYRAWTFVRRNRLPVVFGVALVLLVAGFTVVTLRQNERLAHERDQAQVERARAEQVADFLVGLFSAAKPEEARGREITARDLLERGRRRLDGALDQQPQVKAAMLAVIADASYALDDLRGSYRAASESLALLDSLAAAPARSLATTLAALARVEHEFGLNDDGLAHTARALALASELDVDGQVEMLQQRAMLLLASARREEATALLRQALALQETVADRHDVRVTLVAVRVSRWMPDKDGVAFFAQYVPPDIDALSPEHPLYSDLFTGLSQYWRKQGDLERARRYAETALAHDIRIYGDESSRVARAKNTLGVVFVELGDDARAVALFAQALATSRHLHGNTQNVARTEHNVAAMLMKAGRFDEAEPYLQRAVETMSTLVAADNHTLAFFRRRLGWALRELGRYDDAERMLRLAEATLASGRNEKSLVSTRADLACIAIERSGSSQARDELADALAYLVKQETDAEYHGSLRRCLAKAGQKGP